MKIEVLIILKLILIKFVRKQNFLANLKLQPKKYLNFQTKLNINLWQNSISKVSINILKVAIRTLKHCQSVYLNEMLKFSRYQLNSLEVFPDHVRDFRCMLPDLVLWKSWGYFHKNPCSLLKINFVLDRFMSEPIAIRNIDSKFAQ